MAGATPRELAERIGISHTTIVTAFREAGLPVRGYSETGAKRTELADRALRPEVIRTFRRTRTVATTAEVTGTSKERVRRILVEAGIHVEAYRPWIPKGVQAPAYTTEDASKALRRAARSTGGRVTKQGYQDLAKASRSPASRGWPSADTVVTALGVTTWNEALSAVALPTGHSSGFRTRPRDKELAMIGRLAKRLGRPPTMPEYDAEKRAAMVTAQALTKRSGPWHDVLEAAGIRPPK